MTWKTGIVKAKSNIQTIKNVTINEPYFVGHFPEKPIMPGVLIMESMAQSACLIILDYIDNPKNHLVYLSKVNNFRILKNVEYLLRMHDHCGHVHSSPFL